jgi:hypothetical protein
LKLHKRSIYQAQRFTKKRPSAYNMREQATVNLQVRLQTAHKAEYVGAVTLTDLLIRIKAQANVVIPPDPNGLNFLKQANSLLDPLTHLENVAQDHEAFGPMLLEHGDSLLQLPGVFVNVGQ